MYFVLANNMSVQNKLIYEQFKKLNLRKRCKAQMIRILENSLYTCSFYFAFSYVGQKCFAAKTISQLFPHTVGGRKPDVRTTHHLQLLINRRVSTQPPTSGILRLGGLFGDTLVIFLFGFPC